jgi:hypothetical protein
MRGAPTSRPSGLQIPVAGCSPPRCGQSDAPLCVSDAVAPRGEMRKQTGDAGMRT